jgi:parvulin-like peptidyl-prolyl isomerase
MKNIRIWGGWALGAAGLLLAAAAAAGQSRTVDCIAAVVNNEIVTRADVDVAEALELLEPAGPADPAARRARILDRLIDQLVVLAQVRDAVPTEPALIQSEWAALTARLGQTVIRGLLEGFGLTEAEAREILGRGVRFRRIVAERFGRSVSVTLKEIEAFYAETYAEARKKDGAAVKPLVEVLDAIEAEIKRAKIEVQAAAWIETLRDQAEIEIRLDCLK